jgi:hypothetical protein
MLGSPELPAAGLFMNEASLLAFKSALRKGHGRAMILLKAAPQCPQYVAALLDSCLANQVYDKQCEEERADYLYRLILETGKVESYKKELFRALAEGDGHVEFDPSQVFGILCCIVADGRDDDRIKLREFLAGTDFEPLGSKCIYRYVQLEGIDGFLFCVRRYYGSLSKDLPNSAWVVQSLLDTLNERDGVETAALGLNIIRSEFPELAGLLPLDHDLQRPASAGPQPAQDYASVKAAFDPGRGFPRSWIKTASAAALEEAAGDLLAATDARTIWRYLQIFGLRDYPRAPAELFGFLSCNNQRVVYAAVWALRRLTHPRVRELALQTLSDGMKPDVAIQLLERNFEPEDLGRVERMVEGLALDEEAWHGVGLAILNLYERAPIPAKSAPSLLLRVYEETPCSICRGSSVEKLLARAEVPAWMEDEARFDADTDTARLFGPALPASPIVSD